MGAAFDQVDAYDAWSSCRSIHGRCQPRLRWRSPGSSWAIWRAGGSRSGASRSAAIALPFPTGAFTLAGFITFEVWIARRARPRR